MNLFFDRKFDVNAPEETYDLKLGFESSHTADESQRRKPADTFSMWVAGKVTLLRAIKKGMPRHRDGPLRA